MFFGIWKSCLFDVAICFSLLLNLIPFQFYFILSFIDLGFMFHKLCLLFLLSLFLSRTWDVNVGHMLLISYCCFQLVVSFSYFVLCLVLLMLFNLLSLSRLVLTLDSFSFPALSSVKQELGFRCYHWLPLPKMFIESQLRLISLPFPFCLSHIFCRNL